MLAVGLNNFGVGSNLEGMFITTYYKLNINNKGSELVINGGFSIIIWGKSTFGGMEFRTSRNFFQMKCSKMNFYTICRLKLAFYNS